MILPAVYVEFPIIIILHHIITIIIQESASCNHCITLKDNILHSLTITLLPVDYR